MKFHDSLCIYVFSTGESYTWISTKPFLVEMQLNPQKILGLCSETGLKLIIFRENLVAAYVR